MKNLFLLSAALLLVTISFASNNLTSKPVVKASEILIPIGSSGKTISLLDLSNISAKEYQAYTGKKMNLFDRIQFRVAQRQLKRNINADGTINSAILAKQLSKPADVTSGFHLGGFVLGLLLSLIGVLIAYLINDDKKPARVKWAWIGAAINLILWILFAVL
jgi:hypothetical protein